MIMDRRSHLKVLAIDTCTPRGSAALLEGHTLVAEFRLHSLETHSARLLKSIHFLLDNTGWGLKQIGLVAAGTGPGSFTGIRIGVATALGLAQTMSIPFCGISILDALASGFSHIDGPLGIVMDAQRSQVYYREFIVEAGKLRGVGKAGLYHPESLRKLIGRRRIVLAGDGALRYAEILLSPSSSARVFAGDLFAAASIGNLALASSRKWRKGENLACEPLYIRPPDARKPKGRK
jgi:tRNA threonylcarbamoyladenosine biosynthesis protein TsaB